MDESREFQCLLASVTMRTPSRHLASPPVAPLSDHIDNLDKTRDERTSSIMHPAPTFAVIMQVLYLEHETPRLASSFPLFSSFAFPCSHRDIFPTLVWTDTRHLFTTLLSCTRLSFWCFEDRRHALPPSSTPRSA